MKLIPALILLLTTWGAMAQNSFTESNVTVHNTKAGITLGGTLTVPAQGKPRAALVLATGSGQQNRDEEVLGHRPFKVIAEHLASHGYAVLRIDDRGVGESGGDPTTETIDDYVTDLAASIEKLDSCVGAGIPKGILGHSEGSTAAIKSANTNTSCRFIITMGAPAWQGDSIIMSQARAMATAMTGKWDGEQLQRQLLNLVKSDMPAIMIRPLLYNTIAQTIGEAAKMPQVQKQINAQVEALCSTPYRTMIKYDPAADIKAVAVPWLALNGAKDMQVLPGNLTTITELNPNADTRLLENHNHLMQRCTTGMVQEYATIPEDISPETLDTITAWLNSTL